ncbi:DUF427 domain-containing protein [Streptacidiphilus jiangxiensis]|uniref:Uncharacterized conserved protein, DUF427 family n=1 Tax=Streptacidiphilus jiangxiensis TaxID=235985 RepID=A0A1H7ZBQ0_STRJI|nr:DUF427 domain-containing protein [Streptacidiphilus jiangxiensis]SEM55695.1 Uncharacterized conserved protein, DUF427 family [Streptacidiphilus jiangxiensis]
MKRKDEPPATDTVGVGFDDVAQESVWDYPRPPALVACRSRVTVVFGGVVVADTTRSQRVLETSHPPVYYVPAADETPGALRRGAGESWCEWKGHAVYWDLHVADHVSRRAAWSYPRPAPGFEALADALAFYPGRVDQCLVDGEPVQPQPGDFYGGWITSRIRGPFKGGPGSQGW